MSLQFVEGFEARQHEDLFSDLYEEFPASVSVTTGRLHGSAFLGSSTRRNFLTRPLETSQTWIIGGAWQMNAPESADTVFIGIQDGSSVQLALYVVPNGDDYSFDLYRGEKGAGGVLVAQTAVQAGGAGFNYYEFKGVIDSSVGSYELRKNGIVLLSASDANTQTTGNANANSIRFESQREISAGSGDALYDIDDFYICNGEGVNNIDFLGDQVVEGALPTSDGASSDFTPFPADAVNFDKVDDPANLTPDNDTTYVTATLAGDKDLYGFSTLANATGIISGVMLVTHARTEATGIRVMQHKFHDGTSSEGDAGDPILVQNAVWDDQFAITELNPITGLPYTQAQLNAGQFGYEIVT